MNSVSNFALEAKQNVRSGVEVSSSASRLRMPQLSVTNEIPVRSTFQQLRNSVASPIPSGPSLAILAVADLIGVVLAGLAAVWSLGPAAPDIAPTAYWSLCPVLGVVIIINLLFGMYSGCIVEHNRELRRRAMASCALFLMLACVMYLFPNRLPLSKQLLIGGWLITLAMVPATRAVARLVFGRFSWWEDLVEALDATEAGGVGPMLAQPDLGIRPVVMVDDKSIGRGYWRGVPIVTRLEMAPVVVDQFGARCAIVAIAGTPRKRLLSLLRDQAHTFTSLMVVPDLFDFQPRGYLLVALGMSWQSRCVQPCLTRPGEYSSEHWTLSGSC